MEFDLNRLQAAVKALRPICARGSAAKEVQKGILFKKKVLFANNEEISLAVASDISPTEEEFIIPETAFEMILGLKGDTISLTDEDGTLHLKAGRVRTKFKTFAVDTFAAPRGTGKDGKLFLTDTQLFFDRAEAVLYAVSDEVPGGSVMSCMMLGAENGTLTFTGCNGVQAAFAEMGYRGDDFSELLIPKKAVAELLKHRTQEEQMTVAFDAKSVSFRMGSSVLLARRMEGSYPNVKKMLSGINGEGTTVERMKLLDAITRVNACARSSSDGKKPVIFDFSESGMNISYQSAEASYEELLEDINSLQLRIGFNPKLIEGTLKGVSSDTVTMQLTEANAPLSFRSDSDRTRGIVLPVNISRA